MYRGHLMNCEDNMNAMLEGVTVTGRDGKVTNLEQVYLRGSQIRYFILPDMLRHAPMFKKKGRGAGRGVYGPGGKGRGKGLASRARTAAASRPDVISYTVAMTSCKQEQRWPEAILLLGDATDSFTPIDQSLCTTTVSICSKAAWERALVVFHTASRHRIQAHHSMHNSLVASSGGAWERCVTELTTMQQLDIERSPISFGSMISCCGNCAHWTGSLAFLQKMHEDLGLSLPACTSAVIACVGAKEGGRALRP
eukprot:symbB.v1.2.039143.t1/scaffold6369.1/size18677/3